MSVIPIPQTRVSVETAAFTCSRIICEFTDAQYGHSVGVLCEVRWVIVVHVKLCVWCVITPVSPAHPFSPLFVFVIIGVITLGHLL